ncbi:MAG: hypothetical protein ACRENI_14580 [Gemmatimonadaceae bacterium]
MSTGRDVMEESVPRELELAFLPLHKRAFGVAVGTALALLMLVMTLVPLWRDVGDTIGLGLLAQFFHGYDVSWTGALVAAAWGFAVGFASGWFVAFCRNLVLAISLIAIRSRAEFAATRDFLDHI